MIRKCLFEKELLALTPELKSFACSLSRDPIAAEDLVQETVARALQHKAKFAEGTNLRAWTFTILRNFHHSQWYKTKRTSQWSDGLEDAQESPPEQESAIQLGELFDHIWELPETQRNALLLVGVEGCSYKEAATLASCAVGTMKSRVSRARDALRVAQEKVSDRPRAYAMHSLATILKIAHQIANNMRIAAALP